jgi:hypothetical protein
VVVAWFTGADDTPRVYVAFSPDGGQHWGRRIRIDEGRPAGRVDVVWWGPRALVSWLEETEAGGDVRVREAAPGRRPTRSTIVAPTSVARAAGFPRMVSTGDEVVLAWTAPESDGGVRVVTLARSP